MNKWYEFNRRDRVRVVRGVDGFFPKQHLGQSGVITNIYYKGAGVGESREDPYFTVTFPDGSRDGFWKEELRKES